MINHDETRKHIHDLANSFSVIDASLSRAISLIAKNNPQLTDELTRLRKADEYVKKSIQTIRDLRTHVHNQITEMSKE